VRLLVRGRNFRPKKSLGQHFLVDDYALSQILSAYEVAPADVIIEVGPGLGKLTKELAKQAAKVIAVEIDGRLVSILKTNLSPFPNVRIVHDDILKTTPEQLLEIEPGNYQSYKVIGNIPYYITSPLLRHFLEALIRPSIMVLMVQKEVGEAIVAVPGNMSLLSLRAQFFSKPTIIAHVPAKSFHPTPKVDSLILRLDIYHQLPVQVSDVASFFDMIACGFSSPRKQLRNSLAQSLQVSPNQVASFLEETGVDPKRRAETLNLEEWRKLWEVFAQFRKRT
jgi:16S rRNA (adenine1518-N6/adenine1519-N6)-dimethyltransferase